MLALFATLLILMVPFVQGLDGEATEPMIKELEDDREEDQDPELEFAIAGVMQECGGLEIVVNMVQVLDDLRDCVYPFCVCIFLSGGFMTLYSSCFVFLSQRPQSLL
jgi:hypothetical protein